jgi:cytochrome c553
VNNRIFALFSLILAVGLHAGNAHAGNPELGRTKAAPCAACHGEDGRGISPEFPTLAGQYADYLAHALRQYRDGGRQNAVMAPFAAGLSDSDIRDLAAYFASLKGLTVPKP